MQRYSVTKSASLRTWNYDKKNFMEYLKRILLVQYTTNIWDSGHTRTEIQTRPVSHSRSDVDSFRATNSSLSPAMYQNYRPSSGVREGRRCRKFANAPLSAKTRGCGLSSWTTCLIRPKPTESSRSADVSDMPITGTCACVCKA